MLDLNPVPLVSETTGLPTVPQPLHYLLIKAASKSVKLLHLGLQMVIEYKTYIFNS